MPKIHEFRHVQRSDDLVLGVSRFPRGHPDDVRGRDAEDRDDVFDASCVRLLAILHGAFRHLSGRCG